VSEKVKKQESKAVFSQRNSTRCVLCSFCVSHRPWCSYAAYKDLPLYTDRTAQSHDLFCFVFL